MFRAPSELCCTVRSEMPTFTRSSSATSWSRCRWRSSSTKKWEIISLATENQPGNCDTDMLPPPPGSEPVWWWDSESCSNSVFGETGRRLPDWWAFLVPGLRAEADSFPRHQEVSLSSNICPPPFSNPPDYILFFCRFILHAKKTAFVVEHDLSMVKDLADRVIVFEGVPSKQALANR